jgi:biofilm PGA synthesis N-glycosyltransferase PgaC
MNNTDYVVITPARNEIEHLQKTIDSVAAQTVRPRLWVLVDDGSTDGTGGLLDAAAKTYPWIRVIHRVDRGFRKSGGGVIEAFYDGYALQESVPWEYIVKLDGDLSFEPSYFANCFKHFEEDPKLGLGGGVICNDSAGVLVEEYQGDPPFHVRGATKIYRRACWDEIGGLIRAPGWDTLDEVKANMLGWKTDSFRELKLHHHRFAGKADGNWKNWLKNGKANYIAGYHPLFMLFKCMSRVWEKPFVVGALGLSFGFLGGYLNRVPRVDDKKLIEYLRDQQIRRLTFRESLWTRRS